jgi:hypothetical protein
MTDKENTTMPKLLTGALIYDQTVSQTSTLAACFNLGGASLALITIGYRLICRIFGTWNIPIISSGWSSRR